MPFGIKSASEEFQRRMNEMLGDLKGVKIIVDDILIYGIGDEITEANADHDANLTALLNRLRKFNIKLNPNKINFKTNEVRYIGHVLTDKGIKADPRKTDAIMKMPQPKNIKEMKSFLGIVNYLGKFIPNLSTISEPLR